MSKKKDINIYIIKYLIKHGANINKEYGYDERTFLFDACKNGNEAIVKMEMKLINIFIILNKKYF